MTEESQNASWDERPARGGKSRFVDPYKLATVLLSVAMLLLTFVSVVYYRGQDAASSEQERARQLVSDLQQRRVTLGAAPRLSIEIQTLQESGLPGEALSRIPEMPAFIRIEHAGGGTVRDLAVLFTSSRRIRDVRPGTAVEEYTYELTPDSSALRIEVSRLRPGSLLSVVLMTEGLADLAYEARMEVGQVTSSADTVSEMPVSTGTLLRGDVSGIDVSAFATIPQLDRAIELLQNRPEDQFSIPSWALLVAAGAVWIILAVGGARVLRRVRAGRYEDHGPRIANAARGAKLKLGMTREEVELILKGIDVSEVFASQDGGDRMVARFYAPPAVTRWEPDLLVYYDDSRVSGYHLIEYGDRDYDELPG